LSLPRKRSTALRRIEIGSAVRAASDSGFRHTDGDAALAAPAGAVAGGEIDGVDAAVALSAARGGNALCPADERAKRHARNRERRFGQRFQNSADVMCREASNYLTWFSKIVGG
jgi:hypothetical protein